MTELDSRALPAERAFSLVATLLDSPRPLTRDELLERLRELYVPHGTPEPEPETLRKMFERDKRLVKEMGLALTTVDLDDDGLAPGAETQVGYLVDETDLHLPEIRLDGSQRMLLVAIVQTLLRTPGFPLQQDLAMAAHKILLASGDRPPDTAADPSRLMFDPQAWLQPGAVREMVETALAAVQRRRRLAIRYRAAGRETVTRRTVDPYGLTLVDGSWLLTGWCHLRRQRRTFSLERVRHMAFADPRSSGGEFAVPDDFDAAEVGAVRPWCYAGHDPVEVEVESDGDFAWYAAAIIGVEAPPPGPAPVTFPVTATNTGALVDLALRHGPRIRIRRPAWLAARVVDEVERFAAGSRSVPQAAEAGAPDVGAGRGGRARRDDSLARLKRFAFLVSYLARHPEADLSSLSGTLGVGEPVLAADLQRLSLCGVYPSTDFQLFDVTVDRRAGRVRLRRNPVPALSRPVRLTRREMVALLMGFKSLRDGVAPPFDWAADHVLGEVLRSAGREAALAVRELESRVSMASRHELGWDIFYELSRAVFARSRVRLDYYTQGRDSFGTRVVHPYVLVCSVGRWYLLGHCEWRGEVRTFRLDRIRSARIVDGTFELPEGFDPSRYMASGLYPRSERGTRAPAIVELEPGALTRQLGLDDASAGADGRLRASFDVPADRYEGFVSWLISLGTPFRIAGPPPLVECLERRRRRIVTAHAPTHHPSRDS
jgi:predicted DNA-binding transcriptional regulator YafY